MQSAAFVRIVGRYGVRIGLGIFQNQKRSMNQARAMLSYTLLSQIRPLRFGGVALQLMPSLCYPLAPRSQCTGPRRVAEGISAP